jgi:hypothetical protein
VEWYVNDARGLEQGFTIERDPSENEWDVAMSHLGVHMAVTGSVTAIVDECAQAVDFLAVGGAVAIRLNALHVVDATGRELDAWFESNAADEHASAQSLSIVVDDCGAVYPVTIDPLATSPSWIGETNQPVAHFGWSVATAGDVNGDNYSDIIVGAPLWDSNSTDSGVVFVYHGSPSGLAANWAWANMVDVQSGAVRVQRRGSRRRQWRRLLGRRRRSALLRQLRAWIGRRLVVR